MNHLDDMLEGFVTAAIWTGLDWDNQVDGNLTPLDENFSTDDITSEAIESIRADIKSFYEANRDDLDRYAELRTHDANQGSVWSYAGHDFLLTRNRHGTGFWDRGLGDVGQRLTDAAHVYGEQNLFVNNGKLEIE